MTSFAPRKSYRLDSRYHHKAAVPTKVAQLFVSQATQAMHWCKRHRRPHKTHSASLAGRGVKLCEDGERGHAGNNSLKQFSQANDHVEGVEPKILISTVIE